jgi:hypothetical protein
VAPPEPAAPRHPLLGLAVIRPPFGGEPGKHAAQHIPGGRLRGLLLALGMDFQSVAEAPSEAVSAAVFSEGGTPAAPSSGFLRRRRGRRRRFLDLGPSAAGAVSAD